MADTRRFRYNDGSIHTQTTKSAVAPVVPPQPVAPQSGFQPIALNKLQPVAPVTPATPQPPSTAYDGLQAMLGTMAQQDADSYTQALNDRAAFYKNQSDNSLGALISENLNSTSEAAMRDQQYTSFVDPAQKALNDINNRILQEQNALQTRLDIIDKNKVGMFGGALQAEKQKIQDESTRRQTDFAIQKFVAQGEFDSAKAAADRYVDIKAAEQQKRLDVLSLLYRENKDLFNEAEKRAFETAQADRQQSKDFEIFKLKSDYEQKIRQSDPLYQSQLRKLNEPPTPELGIEMTETERKQTRERTRANGNMLSLLSQYRDLVVTHGFEGSILGNKEVLGQYNSLRGQIVAEYKDAKQLGTLDAGLLTLADQIIGELPQGNALWNNAFGRKSSKIVSQLDTLINETTRQLNSDKQMLGDLSSFIDASDLSEINSIFGTNTSTPASSLGFNPAAYF